MSLRKKLSVAAATTALGAMLIGAGTFAIFSDTATNEGNSFTTGTVDISLDKPNGTHYFDVTNMAPGDEETRYVTISNDGSLDVKYDIQNPVVNGLPLEVKFYDSNGDEITPGNNNRPLNTTDNKTETLTVKVKLPVDTGNEYQQVAGTVGLSFYADQTAHN